MVRLICPHLPIPGQLEFINLPYLKSMAQYSSVYMEALAIASQMGEAYGEVI